ncbi:hypothetical protein EES41_37085 (plasmid) [Streptomyces sp. ADI95-16]|nr:hypothetical protein EES41_37085 [Streptomyces sp. ADI95-16]
MSCGVVGAAPLRYTLGAASGLSLPHRRGLTRQGRRQAAPDCVQRDFTAQEPSLVWVGAMTEIVTAKR